jgi:shikimate kinase
MKIFLIGFMGCGKSYWGKELSQKLQVPFFDLDEKITEKEEKSITEIFADEGEEYFRMLEKDVLHLMSESHDSFIMACGGGTPCYYNNIDYMKKQGVTIWINCSPDCLHGRLLKEKDHRPLIREMSDDQLLSYIIKKTSDRNIFYQQADVILTENEVTLDTLVERVFHS